VCGLIKDIKVPLANYPEVAIVMDVVVIDVPDAWGTLLSRECVIAQIVAWAKPNPNHKGVTTMGVFTHCHLR
jgi:hypothetical protein